MEKNLYTKILQLFILGYEGETPSQKLTSLIKNGLGGIIFFAENLKNRNKVTNTIKDIKKISKTPPFISIDQEGGLVERTIFLDQKIEYLSPKSLSHLNKNDIKTHYNILSSDIISIGFNLNFAPVIDVNSNPQNPIISIRSFGNIPDLVNTNAKIVIDAFKKNGLLSCAKHYPGHGDTISDSHKIMPCVNMCFDEFYKTHLVCFKKAIENKVDTIMISHIHFPFFDKIATPASLSKNAINYLKNELNFSGIIFSDDMVMGGISKNYGLKESIILALKAGIDSLIFRNITDELIDAIKDISKTQDKELINNIERAYKKIIEFKKKHLKNTDFNTFDTIKHQTIIDKIAQKTPIISGSFTLKNSDNIKIVAFDNKEIFNLSAIKNNLSDFIKSNNLSEIKYPTNPTKKDIIKIIKKINNTDVVIFLSYNPQINLGQIELFNSLPCKKILVHCGLEPHNIQMDKPECTIFTYCYKTPILKALGNIFSQK